VECELCLWKPTHLAKYILESGVEALSNGIEQKQAEAFANGLIMRHVCPRVACLTNGFVRGAQSAGASVECRPATRARTSPQRIGGHIDTEGATQVVTDKEVPRHIRLR
jgi:hypothetical protein